MAVLFLVLLPLAWVAFSMARAFTPRRRAARTPSINDAKASPIERQTTNRDSKTPEDMPPIEPLADFDWTTTPPARLRPFKPVYHITMAIKSSPPSDLIAMDNNYLDRVTARRKIMADHTSTVLGVVPSGHAPIRELYTYLLGTYLPTRYPTMFSLVQTKAQTQLHNKVTNLTAPLHPPPSNPSEMLQILGETVEDDMFLLLRDKDDDGGEHRAVAFVCCHPSGFDPSEKLGKTLAEIHSPVPAYEKIGASMERYFARVEVGKGVRRENWGIQTHPNLYAPPSGRNHIPILTHPPKRKEPPTRPPTDPTLEDDDDNDAHFRVEQQTLTRLPDTRALLFSFKTYLYPLADLTAEGLGPRLAEAIEGLGAGNAPGMWGYKGGGGWGRAVREVLLRGGGV